MHSGTSASVIVLLDRTIVRDEAYVLIRTPSEVIRYQCDESQERCVKFYDNTLYKPWFVYVAAQRSGRIIGPNNRSTIESIHCMLTVYKN